MEVSGLSIWVACRFANLHHKMFITWKREIVRMQESNKKAKSVCLGPSLILHAFEDQLLCYIFQLQEQGMPVSSRLDIFKASSLCRELQERAEVVQYSSVRRFIKNNGLVHQMGMNISQKDPRELEDIAAHSW